MSDQPAGTEFERHATSKRPSFFAEFAHFLMDNKKYGVRFIYIRRAALASELVDEKPVASEIDHLIVVKYINGGEEMILCRSHSAVST